MSQFMSRAACNAAADRRDPEFVANLLEVVAEHDVDHALSHIEQLVARLRAGSEEAAAAREVLRNTPTEVLRQALRLRSARIEPTR